MALDIRMKAKQRFPSEDEQNQRITQQLKEQIVGLTFGQCFDNVPVSGSGTGTPRCDPTTPMAYFAHEAALLRSELESNREL